MSKTTTQRLFGMRAAAISSLGAVVLVLAGCRQQAAAPVTSAAVTPATPAARKAAHEPYTKPSSVPKHLYPPAERAVSDIAAAEKRAKTEGKRVLLDFGADWCGDCEVLDIYFHREPNASLLEKNFIEVKVNIGYEDLNMDLARRYGVNIVGVPALAVLSPDGKVLYAQKEEFRDMRYMEPAEVAAFLNRWKPVSSADQPSPGF